MLILLSGYSGTGKSSVSKILVDKYNCRRIVTCTTRPKRENETNEYLFMDNDIFEIFVKKGLFTEVTEYNASYGLARYGTLEWIVKDAIRSNMPYILIVDPSGLQYYTKTYPDRVISFILQADIDLLKSRLKLRKDNEQEIDRRIEADKKAFNFTYSSDIIQIDASESIDNVAKNIILSVRDWYLSRNIQIPTLQQWRDK